MKKIVVWDLKRRAYGSHYRELVFVGGGRRSWEMVSNEKQGVRRQPFVQQGKIKAADLGLSRLIPRTGNGQETHAAEDTAIQKIPARFYLHGGAGTGSNACPVTRRL
jgi:hypothetical protein